MLSNIQPSRLSLAAVQRENTGQDVAVLLGFIRNARISHFLMCIQVEKDHTNYARRMRELGQYHARGIHSWSGGQC